MIVSAEN